MLKCLAPSTLSEHTALQALIIFLSFLISFERACGWDEMGHQVVGEIAEQILKERDPQTLRVIHSIIGVEPLAVAAIWPDRIKSDPRFKDFSPYHYTTKYRDPKKRDEKDALTVLKEYPLVLRDPHKSREAKMMALRFIIHVAGDIHQPLHVGNGFDRGGNDCRVVWRPGASKDNAKNVVNFHSVWDSYLVEWVAEKIKNEMKNPPRYFDYMPVSQNLMVRHKKKWQQKLKVDVEAWVNESAEIRKTKVYPDSLSERERSYCRGGQSERDKKMTKKKMIKMRSDEVPVLDAEYIKKTAPIVEERLVFGGARLAAYLSDLFKKEEFIGQRIDQEEVLNSLGLKNSAALEP